MDFKERRTEHQARSRVDPDAMHLWTKLIDVDRTIHSRLTVSSRCHVLWVIACEGLLAASGRATIAPSLFKRPVRKVTNHSMICTARVHCGAGSDC